MTSVSHANPYSHVPAIKSRNQHQGYAHMRYGLLSYNRTNNIGDEIQSLAARRFLPQVDDLVERDRLADFQPEETTRLICNGWFLHNPEMFQFNGNLEPLLISFHITPLSGADGLSSSFAHLLATVADTREILKRYGPVGARDIYTWKLLQEFGIPSYFSGCLTLTLNNEAPKREEWIVVTDVHPSVMSHVRASSDREILSLRHSFDWTQGELKLL